ncbi:MAG: YfaZ family protein [Acidobacteria bacterium]|nr:YfaZ family protein [Acidobacteriota bacterium]
MKTFRRTALFHILFALVSVLAFYSQTNAQDDPETPPVRRTRTTQQRNERQVMEVEIRYWFDTAKLSAKAVDIATGGGTRASGTGILNMETTNPPEVRTTFFISRNNKLRFDYFQFKALGSTDTLSLSLSNGRTIGDVLSTGDVLTGSADIKQAKISYAWQGIRAGDRVKIGPLAEIRGFFFRGTLVEPPRPGLTAGRTSTGEAGAAMGTLGANLTILAHRRMEIDSVITGINLGGIGRIFDADTTVKFIMHRNITINSGYRYLRLRADDERSNSAELLIRGPIVGVGFRF